MSRDIVPFAKTLSCIKEIFDNPDSWPSVAPRLCVIRDLYGRVRIALSEDSKEKVENEYHNHLKLIVHQLREALGPHAYSDKDSILYIPTSMLDRPGRASHKIGPHDNVRLAERLVEGHSWWTFKENIWTGSAKRYVLYSVKGGVGRSTTASILAWNLARRTSERVMIVDLDLESPGLSSEFLSTDAQPDYGIVDWFVEDLVGQGDRVIDKMTVMLPCDHFPGEICVVPAHGKEPREFLAKLGRTYLHTLDKESGEGVAWESRLGWLLSKLEEKHRPTIVLLESRSGLNNFAASAVSDLNAKVLLFAVNSESTWTNYQMLFGHWVDHGLAQRIRKNLSIVSALTPSKGTPSYLEDFQENAWNLFGHLYDEIDSQQGLVDNFSYAIDDPDEFVPHRPIPIYWVEGLAAGTSLQNLEKSEIAVQYAYSDFLRRFDDLVKYYDEE